MPKLCNFQSLLCSLLTRHQVAKDIPHLYHLDLLHVPCGSLPCVNQNCEGAACKRNGGLQIRGQLTEDRSDTTSCLKPSKAVLSGCRDMLTWGVVVKHSIAHTDLEDEGTQ